ncbi:MAG: ATP-binding protein [Anaerolineae bacterium]|nr:ATP-binding protein [Anaerolineae bacterium]
MIHGKLLDSLRQWIERMRRFFSASIRNKIIMPYLVLTFIVALVGIYVVTRLVVTSVDERLTNQLLEAGRVVSDLMARKEIEHIQKARTIGYARGVAEALVEGRHTDLLDLVTVEVYNQGVECFILADRNGQAVVHLLRQADGSYRPIAEPLDLSQLQIVNALLEANDLSIPARRGLAFHPASQRYYYVTAVPVGLNRQLVAVALVGTSLETLLRHFKDTALADVIIYLDGGRAVDATFAFAEQEEERPALLETLAIPHTLYENALRTRGNTEISSITVRGRHYRAANGPLSIGNDTLGVFAVALPLNFLIETNVATRNTYALIFTLGMGSVILVGYWISQHITRPIRKLVSTSQAVAEGDLRQRTGVVSNDEVGILAESFDKMTERLAERTYKLEETLGRMQAILSSMNDGVILEDTEGNLLPLNAAASQLLEEMAENFMLGPLRELSTDVRREGNAASSRRRFEVGNKVISAQSAAVRTEDGRHLGSVLVLRDVTAEVEAERLKDQFITHVSHELRTPLTAIKGYNDLLLAGAGGELNESMRGFLEVIGRNADDLIAMVSELLDFSEMEASGHLGMIKRPMDMRAVAEEVAEEWRPRMAEKGLTFQVELPPELPLLNGDARRLRWAVLHLVRNALQYTPAGGTVTLRLSEQNGHVVLDVTDTGIGIAEEDQERLFTRFYRVTNMPPEDVRGLGVGLYLTRAIVEAHGGEIRVTSRVGAGSTFSIVLPVHQE